MAEVRPLKVNGSVKSKLIPIRSKEHPSATPAAFKARARLYRLLEPARPRRLDTLLLISSVHGGMTRTLFTMMTLPGCATGTSPPGTVSSVRTSRGRVAADPWAWKLGTTGDNDAENGRGWRSLGYEVELLPDFHPIAARLGAAHCIAKCLARQ